MIKTPSVNLKLEVFWLRSRRESFGFSRAKDSSLGKRLTHVVLYNNITHKGDLNGHLLTQRKTDFCERCQKGLFPSGHFDSNLSQFETTRKGKRHKSITQSIVSGRSLVLSMTHHTGTCAWNTAVITDVLSLDLNHKLQERDHSLWFLF